MNSENIKITKETLAPCQVKINVEVAQSEIKSAFDKVAGQFSKRAQLPGFRAGKAPKAMVIKAFKDRIVQQVSEEVINKGYELAFQEEEAMPATYPTLEAGDLEIDKDYTFSLKFDVEPTFELPDYKSIKLEREEVVVSDEDIDAELEKFAQSRKTYETAEADVAGEAGDMLKVTYTATLADGEEAPEAAKTVLNAEDTWLLLGQPEMIPGTAEGLLGMKAGDEKEMTVEFPADFWEASVAGKTADYKFSVSEVQKSVVPAIDDELAKSAGVDSLDALKETIKNHLQSSRQYEAEQNLQNELNKELIKLTGEFEIPASLLEQEVKDHTERKMREAMQAAQAGIAVPEQPSTDEIEAEAKERVQSYYILRAIAKEEGIRANESDIDSQLEMLGHYRNVNPKLMKRKLMKDGRIQGMAMDIALSKTVQKLIADATGASSEEN